MQQDVGVALRHGGSAIIAQGFIPGIRRNRPAFPAPLLFLFSPVRERGRGTGSLAPRGRRNPGMNPWAMIAPDQSRGASAALATEI